MFENSIATLRLGTSNSRDSSHVRKGFVRSVGHFSVRP